MSKYKQVYLPFLGIFIIHISYAISSLALTFDFRDFLQITYLEVFYIIFWIVLVIGVVHLYLKKNNLKRFN